MGLLVKIYLSSLVIVFTSCSLFSKTILELIFRKGCPTLKSGLCQDDNKGLGGGVTPGNWTQSDTNNLDHDSVQEPNIHNMSADRGGRQDGLCLGFLESAQTV